MQLNFIIDVTVSPVIIERDGWMGLGYGLCEAKTPIESRPSNFKLIWWPCLGEKLVFWPFLDPFWPFGVLTDWKGKNGLNEEVASHQDLTSWGHLFFPFQSWKTIFFICQNCWHVFMRWACTFTHVLSQIFLISSGDQTWHMQKVWWTSDIIWKSVTFVKTNKHTHMQAPLNFTIYVTQSLNPAGIEYEHPL